MVQNLVQNQRRDGSFTGVTETITCSKGQTLIIETTSFALLAMMRVDFSRWESKIRMGIEYLMGQMEYGFFGSSQASVLAFKALMEFLERNKSEKEFPLFQVKVNGVAHFIQTGDPLKKHKNRNFIYFLTYRCESVSYTHLTLPTKA